jgi:hypothetical protein
MIPLSLETAMKQEEEITRIAANRRNFLKGAGLAGIGMAGAAMIGTKLGTPGQNVQASAYSDAEILNFALNLEYLEAEFYLMATYGTTLVKHGVITAAEQSGPTTGGSKVSMFGWQGTLATALREDEIAHVKYLRAALGSNAVKKPAINLDALGYGFSSVNSFLKLARQFEDVGVSAYLGAAPLINSSTYLAAAGAILATEAQHSGSVRFACFTNGIASPAVDSRDVPPTSANPYDVNSSNALSIPRTPAEVLNIVYHGGKCSGGFYPDGMNGSIVCQ